MSLSPQQKLDIEERLKEEGKENSARFAMKWVEAFARWLIIGVGTAVLGAIMKLILIP